MDILALCATVYCMTLHITLYIVYDTVYDIVPSDWIRGGEG